MTGLHEKEGRSNFRQQGMALIGMAFFIFVVLLGFLINQKSGADVEAERERVTTRALMQAKAALIAYAATVDLNTGLTCGYNCARPGDLPCPDMDNNGNVELDCGNATGTSQQAERLGRLPWKTLKISDIRDGYGERLWYAVSNNFKYNTKNMILNSDTFGTITIRDSTGSIIYDGSAQNGVVAVIFSPGPPLKRQNATVAQDRSCTRAGTDDPLCVTNNNEICTSPTAQNTNKCNPQNYLDKLDGVEDNKEFDEIGSSVNGFINGPIKDASGNVIVNDRILVVTIDDIMPQIEKRVIREVRTCLNEYAATAGNNSRYPWATDAHPSYSDTNNQRFGRIPDTTFNNTKASGSTMSDTWPTSECKIVSNANWWSTNNWKELIFYGVASAFEPNSTTATTCGTCLRVFPLTSTDKKFVVIAAAKKLSGQNRSSASDKTTITNYLELENSTPTDNIFQQGPTTTTFNDKVIFSPAP
jgi:hypothetical protein